MKKNNNNFDDDENFDDFDFDNQGYDSEYLEEDVNLDENFDDEDWGSETGTQKEKSKPTKVKKSSNFNTIVIAGAFVVGILVLVFNVMSKSEEQAKSVGDVFRSSMSVADVMDGGLSSAQISETDGAVNPKPNLPEEGQASGFFNDTQSLEDLDSKVEDSPPMPSPISSVADNNTIMESVVTPLPVQEEMDVSANDFSAATLSAEDVLKNAMSKREQKIDLTNDLSDENVPEVPSSLNANTSQAKSNDAVGQETSKEIDKKLELILQRMESLEKDLSSMKIENKTIQENLNNRISNLQNIVEDRKNDVVNVPVQKQPEPPVKTEKKIAPKEPVKATPSPAPVKKVNKPIVWELRAAQPGRAWVSKQGERDMQSVEVGQTLPNIGQIRAITYQNGLWTVMGTNGTISQ